MSRNRDFAFYACLINSSIWAASGTVHGAVLSVVWLVAAAIAGGAR